jgi:hypothetical protein
MREKVRLYGEMPYALHPFPAKEGPNQHRLANSLEDALR